MLFNSLPFLLAFLPGAVLLHELTLRIRPTARRAVLLALSLVFYASFDLRFVPLLVGSVVLNWGAGRLWERTGSAAVLYGAGAIDLGLLGAYKYTDFVRDAVASLSGTPAHHLDWAFPLGISFFTFGHIAYLIDLRRGKTRPASLLDYGLYVAFFPKIIAGPLVRPGTFLPALRVLPERWPEAGERIGRAFLLLLLGLAKKVGLGDPLGALVDPVFAAAQKGDVVPVLDAWTATLGYAFQLYFDFAGYTDMALAVALMLGITLPPNFEAPYRATSIQDFWRRWHITLSFFLRDYLYIPFGGNRHGLARQVAALVATMLLGGLWHGAGWTFVAWGGAHGVALAGHLLWRRAGRAMPNAVGLLLTFGFVTAAWVVFRAPSFGAALGIFHSLAGSGPPGALTLGEAGLLFVAAICAFAGPTALAWSRRVPPRPLVFAAAGVALALVLVRIGNDGNADFIYARF